MSHTRRHHMARGSRRQVWNGTAKRTSGGLTKSQLVRVKRGDSYRIVSRAKRSMAIRRNFIGRLKKKNFFTKKGVFGCFRKDSKGKLVKCGKGSRRMRGGAMSPLSPSTFQGSGSGMGDSTAVQFRAGNAN